MRAVAEAAWRYEGTAVAAPQLSSECLCVYVLLRVRLPPTFSITLSYARSLIATLISYKTTVLKNYHKVALGRNHGDTQLRLS